MRCETTVGTEKRRRLISVGLHAINYKHGAHSEITYFNQEVIVGFVDTAYSVSEGDVSVNVTVEIKQGKVGNGETVILELTTRDNTATSMSTTEKYLCLDILNFYHLPSFPPGSSDYISTTQILTFISGQTIGIRFPITIQIVNDNIAESNKSFFGSLTLLHTKLDVSVTPNQTEIFITDNNRKN